MLTGELSELEEVGALIEHGRPGGVLMYAEVAQAVSELDLDEADTEKLHGLLEKRGVELVEAFEPAAAADFQEALGARAEKAETPLDLTSDSTTDSLQLFLKGIGKVPLLTRPQELALAKRIERGDLGAKQRMVESNLRLVVAFATPARLETLHRAAPRQVSCPGTGLRSGRLTDGVAIHGWRRLISLPSRRRLLEAALNGASENPVRRTSGRDARTACKTKCWPRGRNLFALVPRLVRA